MLCVLIALMINLFYVLLARTSSDEATLRFDSSCVVCRGRTLCFDRESEKYVLHCGCSYIARALCFACSYVRCRERALRFGGSCVLLPRATDLFHGWIPRALCVEAVLYFATSYVLF